MTQALLDESKNSRLAQVTKVPLPRDDCDGSHLVEDDELGDSVSRQV